MASGTHSFVHLTEGHLPVEDGRNRIYFCELNRYYSGNVFRDFSIKYTLEGAVHYQTEKDQYELLPDSFLLSSKQPCECIVESKSITRNISIDISENTMHEVWTILSRNKDLQLDNLADGHFTSAHFFEHIYPTGHSDLGQYLKKFALSLKGSGARDMCVTDETFFLLAEKVVEHELGIRTSLNRLEAVKTSTREETLRRLLNGKYFIDQHFLSDLHIPQIAKHAHLSQYYFFRNFKHAFQCTPYQYILHKRLEHARTRLLQGESIQDVAEASGFPDSFNFSKCFKKKYGSPPTSFKKQLSHPEVMA